MNVRYDRDIVLAKASTVKHCLDAVQAVQPERGLDLPDWVRFDVTVLNLQRAVEACLDLAHHLIAANRWELPASAADAFTILARHEVLSEPEARSARDMVGFRNVAVHNYTEIDPEVVRTILQRGVSQIEQIVRRIVKLTAGSGDS